MKLLSITESIFTNKYGQNYFGVYTVEPRFNKPLLQQSPG